MPRFAANLLVLPEGLYYGRIDPLDAAELVHRHQAGRLLLYRLRTAEFDGLDAKKIIVLAEKGVKTLDDLADLAGDLVAAPGFRLVETSPSRRLLLSACLFLGGFLFFLGFARATEEEKESQLKRVRDFQATHAQEAEEDHRLVALVGG